MRLIDADKLAKQMGLNAAALVLIQNAPTVEPVPTKSQFKRMAVQLGYEPVVYCDVCVKRGTRHCPIYPKENGDDYCSYGERRNDD